MLCICSDLNKKIYSENTFEKLLFNQVPYSLQLTTVVTIAKAHSLNENDGIGTKGAREQHKTFA